MLYYTILYYTILHCTTLSEWCASRPHARQTATTRRRPPCRSSPRAYVYLTCVYICIYYIMLLCCVTWICICVCVCVYIHMYTHMYMHYTHTSIYRSLSLSLSLFISIYIYMYIYIYIYLHTYTLCTCVQPARTLAAQPTESLGELLPFPHIRIRIYACVIRIVIHTHIWYAYMLCVHDVHRIQGLVATWKLSCAL